MRAHEYLKRWSATGVLALVLGGLSATGAAAQRSKPADPTSATPVRLSDAVYEEESVGLTMRLPEGVKITRNPQSTQRILIETLDMSWIGTLEVILTRNEAETIAAVTDRALETSRGTGDSSRQRVREFKERYRKALRIGDKDAEQFAVELSMETRDGVMREVRVYTIFNPTPGTFVIYGVRGDGVRADEIIALTQASAETFRFRDPAAVAQELQQGVDATVKALARLKAEDYRRMIVPETWYRVYRKDDRGEREVAYYRFREDIGPRGLVGESPDPARFVPAEKEEGLLVSQTARFLVAGDTAEDAFVSEVESLAWMSFDRQREIWSTRQVMYEKVRGGYNVLSRSSISGTRQGGRIDLFVNVPDGSGGSSTFTTPDAYVSQAEQHLLYRILNPGREGSYVMYNFRPQTADIKRRTEIIKPMAGNADRFTVESRLDPAQPPTIKTISGKGEIVRMVSAEGHITEPSDPARLAQLWKARGLPTGEIKPIADLTRPQP